MIEPDKYQEPITIGMKIIGLLVAVISFRWLIRLFSGKDQKLGVDEFKNLSACLLFGWAAVYMILKEGNRTDLSHEVYGMGYLSIVFGSLLFALHMDKALESISKIVEALVKLRTGARSIVQETTVQQNTKEEVTQ